MKRAVACAVVLCVLMAFAGGCRTRSRVTVNYAQSGVIQSVLYESDSGFHFFSDGEGKTLSPSFSINGLSF